MKRSLEDDVKLFAKDLDPTVSWEQQPSSEKARFFKRLYAGMGFFFLTKGEKFCTKQWMMQLQGIYYKLCRTSHGHMAACCSTYCMLFYAFRILFNKMNVCLQLEMCMHCLSMTNVFVVTSATASMKTLASRVMFAMMSFIIQLHRVMCLSYSSDAIKSQLNLYSVEMCTHGTLMLLA